MSFSYLLFLPGFFLAVTPGRLVFLILIRPSSNNPSNELQNFQNECRNDFERSPTRPSFRLKRDLCD